MIKRLRFDEPTQPVKESSGVYVIRNKENGKVYIGESNNVFTRFDQHQSELTRKVHRNKVLQKDWNKYGSSAFSFEVLVINFTEGVPVETRRNMERHYIDKYAPIAYNESQNPLREVVSPPLNLRTNVPNQVTINGILFPSVAEAMRAYKVSKATIRYRLKNNVPFPELSEEAIANINYRVRTAEDNQRQKSNVAVVIDGIEYYSQTEAARKSGLSRSTILRRLKKPDSLNYVIEKNKKPETFHNLLETKPVIIEGQFFKSIAAAAKVLNLTKNQIFEKIKNPKYTESWHFVD